MMDVNQTPPDRMTPEQRRIEVATLLARGLARLRSTTDNQFVSLVSENEFELAFPLGQSVHEDSSNNRNEESR